MIPPYFIQQLLARVDSRRYHAGRSSCKNSGQNYSVAVRFITTKKRPAFSVIPANRFLYLSLLLGCRPVASAPRYPFCMEYSFMGLRDAVRAGLGSSGINMGPRGHRGDAIERPRCGRASTNHGAGHAVLTGQRTKPSPTAIPFQGALRYPVRSPPIRPRLAPDRWQGLNGGREELLCVGG